MLSSFKKVKVKNERKTLHCVQCRRNTIHAVEARCAGSWHYENSGSGGQTYSIYRCGACDEVCYETGSWDENDLEYGDEGPEVAYRYKQYPAPVSAHFNFNTESTPIVLDTILDEMLYALAGSKTVLATIGLRMAIEFIVKDKECKGNTLVKQINDLETQGIIDADQKDLLHKIRRRGNDSAHDAKGMNPKELVAAMSIVEGLLEKLYNGPARHEATIRKAKRLLRDKDDESSEENG